MNILLVTSQVTYIKDNYYTLLKTLTHELGGHVAGLLVIENRSFELAAKAFAVMAFGARITGTALLKNMVTSGFGKREALFKRVIYSRDINDPATITTLRALDLDVIVNLRTRCRYKKDVLDLPRKGCINIHHGRLPENRGTMCDLWAMAEKRPVFFSIHGMNETIDGGDILARGEVPLKKVKTYSDLTYGSSLLEGPALVRVLKAMIQNKPVRAMKNDKAEVRYSKDPGLRDIRAMRKAGVRI